MVTITLASATASMAEPAMATPSALAAAQEAATRSKPATLAPGLHQIGGHRPAHIAETDKGDVPHVLPLHVFLDC